MTRLKPITSLMLMVGFMSPLHSYADEVADLLSSGGLTETHQTENGTNTSAAPFYQPDGTGSDDYSPVISLSNTSNTNSAITSAISSSSSSSSSASWHTASSISQTGANSIPDGALAMKAVIRSHRSTSRTCTVTEVVDNALLYIKSGLSGTATYTCSSTGNGTGYLYMNSSSVYTNYENYSILVSLSWYY